MCSVVGAHIAKIRSQAAAAYFLAPLDPIAPGPHLPRRPSLRPSASRNRRKTNGWYRQASISESSAGNFATHVPPHFVIESPPLRAILFLSRLEVLGRDLIRFIPPGSTNFIIETLAARYTSINAGGASLAHTFSCDTG